MTPNSTADTSAVQANTREAEDALDAYQADGFTMSEDERIGFKAGYRYARLSHTDQPVGNLDALVAPYVESYEFRGDDGDYSPNALTRTLIEDALHGFIAQHLSAAPASPAVGGDVEAAFRAGYGEGKWRDTPWTEYNPSARRKLREDQFYDRQSGLFMEAA